MNCPGLVHAMEHGERIVGISPLAVTSTVLLQDNLHAGNHQLQFQRLAPHLIIPTPGIVINTQMLSVNRSPESDLYRPFNPSCNNFVIQDGNLETLSSFMVVPPLAQVSKTAASFPQVQVQILPASMLLTDPLRDAYALTPPTLQDKNNRIPINEKQSLTRLLEILKNSGHVKLTDLIGSISEAAKDQYGSRFIQQKIKNADKAEKSLLLAEILPSLMQLSVDIFGNYVVQRIIESWDETFYKELKTKIIESSPFLALHVYGCRVVQKAMEVFQENDKYSLMRQLEHCVLDCCYDQNGNHVIQKAIELLSGGDIWFILGRFKGQVVRMSCHLYACRIIQRSLMYAPDQTGFILEEILSNLKTLIKDQYGNYVVQYIVEKGKPEERESIISAIQGQVARLSRHKYASNVVEKCMSCSNDQQRSKLFDEVCSSGDVSLDSQISNLETLAEAISPSQCKVDKKQPLVSRSTPLDDMLKDQFGNYVIQKMLDVADGQQGKMLVARMKPHVACLKTFVYGKYVLAKWEKCKSRCGAVDVDDSIR